jgi:hypothetical protein
VPLTALVAVPNKPEVPTPKKREFVDISPEALLGLSNQKDLTRVQTDLMIKPYIGKWLRVTGAITDIYPNAVALRTTEGKPSAGGLAFDVILIVDDV